MSKPCSVCGHVHSPEDAVAIGRFRADGVTGYTSTAPPEHPLRGSREEAVVYAVHAKGAQVDHHCPLVSPDMAADYLPGCATPLYTSPQPGPDVRGLVSADDVRDACANAVSVIAEETNADQCREVAEYMREVLLAQIDRRQAQRQA